MDICSIILLTTRSSYYYLMWDFIHTCKSNIDNDEMLHETMKQLFQV